MYENDDDEIDFELSYEEMLKSDDPFLREAAKAAMSEGGDVNELADEDDATQGGETENEQLDQAEEQTESEDAEQEKQQSQERYDGVVAKDGKNYLPYSELEKTRASAAEYKTQSEQFAREKEQLQGETEKLRRQIELANSRGMELPTLPEDEKITDEMVQELDDVSPEFGVLARKLLSMEQQLAKAQTKPEVQAQQPDEVEPVYSQEQINTAIKANPAMLHIVKNPQLLKLAQRVEMDIDGDPRFPTIKSRYAELARRVGDAERIDFASMYGAQSVGMQVKPRSHLDDSPAMPHSMSDVPSSETLSSGRKTQAELLADQSPQRLHDEVGNMSMDQLEALLGG